MACFNKGVLTKAGRTLQAKAETGIPLRITKYKVGSGIVTEDEIDSMVDLKEPRMDMGIITNTAADGMCTLTCTLTTKGLEEGFYARELGLFAMDPDVGEILYLMFITDTPDMIPPESIGPIITVEYKTDIVISNVEKISVDIDPHGLVTVDQMQSMARILQRSTAYKVGDLLYDGRLRPGFFLKCIQAGTTGDKDCYPNKVTLNDTITDGSVVWKVCRMTIDVGDAFQSVKDGLVAGTLDSVDDFAEFIQQEDGSIIAASRRFSTAKIMRMANGNLIVSAVAVQADDDSDDNIDPNEGVTLATNEDMDKLAAKFDY